MTASQSEIARSISVKQSHEYYLDRWLGLYEFDDYRKWLFSELLGMLKEHVKHGSILEIGCSKGYLSRLLDKNGYSSVGGDISKTALSYARNIKTVRLDGETLPFRNSCFDAVLAISTIEHLPKPEFCVQEVSRVPKKNGLFIIITPDKDSVLGKVGYHVVDYTSLKNPYHVRLMNKNELAVILKNAGFEQFYVHPFHNGFFGAPFINQILPQKVLPIPLKVPLPFSCHLMAIAYKSTHETNLKTFVAEPEILQYPQ
jgi:SAM-dependent methyltransferase